MINQSQTGSPETFDAIIVGSGMGGLTAASVLVQLHKMKVLVLENHVVAGGFTHTFSRRGYTWDIGLHYVGQMQPNTLTRNAFDFITGGKVDWRKIISPFESFCYPGQRFDVPDDPSSYIEKLIELFPEEKQAIKRYFSDIKKIPLAMMPAFMPSTLRPILRFLFKRIHRLAKTTVKTYMNEQFQNSRLRSLLVSQWGDYGLPPSQASMLIHATIVKHYLEGAYYPVGGAAQIAKSVEMILHQGGSKILTGRNVNKFLIDETQKIIGVQVCSKDGSSQEYFAPLVFSNIGIENTYKLLPKNIIPKKIREELENLPEGITNVTAYYGLKSDPRELNIWGQNFWIFNDWDHEKIFLEKECILYGNPNHCYLSFPSLKDPHAKKHTAEAIAFVSHSAFDKWTESRWRKRPNDYEDLKQNISKGLLALIEREIPGFSNLVEYVEISTPLTVNHFTSHPRGQIYGIGASPQRSELQVTNPKTPVKGLHLVGADVAGAGIVGSLMGSLLSIAKVKGWRIMRRAMAGASEKSTEAH